MIKYERNNRKNWSKSSVREPYIPVLFLVLDGGHVALNTFRYLV
jgi:hypothetical protein